MGINAVSNYQASNGSLVSRADTKSSLPETFSLLVQEKREELYEKIKNGETEPRYPIGAGSYTEKEWERLLKSFDKVQEMIRKEAGLENKKKMHKTENKNEDIEEFMDAADASLLFAECICCMNPPVSSKDFWEDFLNDKIDMEQFMQENLSA